MEQRNFNSYSNLPTVTKNLLIINALLWVATEFIMRDKVDLTDILGLHFPGARDFKPHQFFTYMFMHASFSHLFFNMFAVYMFGRTLESTWGSRRFLFYYLATGLGAGVIQELVWLNTVNEIASAHGISIATLIANPSFSIPVTVGASGAVFGILLAFGMYYPNVEMFIIPFPFPIKAKYLVIGYGVIELFAGIADFKGDNIAHFAHLGGMLFGLILVLYWKKKDKNDGRYYY
jgi:membrane associated rhomboid family serine protease